MIVVPSVTPAQFIAGLGLTSVAICFAFKDVFENFLAGVIILGRDKMQIGDVIECEGVYGRIENIWIRETHVRRVDGELVIVPNAFLFQNPLRIQTDRNRIRQEMIIGVDYATDLPTAKRVLREALDGCKSIDVTLERAVQCVSFGGSSIDFQILWWTESQPADQRSSFDEVAFAVKAALDKAEITIPFPQTTLSLRPEHVPLTTVRAA
jgi:small-conductance mechanosensitive channel